MLSAGDAMAQKYGEAEWRRLAPRVGERLQEQPWLIPDEVKTSPSLLARSLEDVLTLVRGDVAVEDKRNYWQKVKDADTGIPSFYPGPQGR